MDTSLRLQLNTILRKPTYTPSDYLTVWKVLSYIPERSRNEVMQFLVEHPKVIPIVITRFWDKKEVLKTGNRELWEKVLNNEEQLLGQLVQGKV